METSLAEITPLVSVCIPAYNCELYIEETLHCLCAQNYSNIEIIIVDDGSTDGTAESIRKQTDTRIKLVSKPNKGAASARNAAYNLSKGVYIIFFDADDFVHPDFISAQVSKIRENPDVVVLSRWGRFYSADRLDFAEVSVPGNDMFFEDWINVYWREYNPMTNPGRAIISRKLIEASGLWDESLNLNDDMEFFTRMFLNAQKIIFNYNSVLYYRSGVAGLSSKKGKKEYQSLYNSIALSIEYALLRYPDSPDVKQSCANLWQGFIYDVYPGEQRLIKMASNRIKKLAKPNLRFPSGGITKFLASIIGWKLTKKIKWAKQFA